MCFLRLHNKIIRSQCIWSSPIVISSLIGSFILAPYWKCNGFWLAGDQNAINDLMQMRLIGGGGNMMAEKLEVSPVLLKLKTFMARAPGKDMRTFVPLIPLFQTAQIANQFHEITPTVPLGSRRQTTSGKEVWRHKRTPPALSRVDRST